MNVIKLVTASMISKTSLSSTDLKFENIRLIKHDIILGVQRINENTSNITKHGTQLLK